jgi:DNA-nicking Smr family endonuclease
MREEMARKKKRSSDTEGRPARRGKRRSIRYEAEEQWPEERRRPRDQGAPPGILLRKLSVNEALERLDFQLRAYAAKGQAKVLVVHGKGGASPGGVSILGPEVRNWCDAHPAVVVSWSEAPPKWGGSGAIVVVLRLEP